MQLQRPPRNLTTATIAAKVEDALAEEDLVLGNMNNWSIYVLHHKNEALHIIVTLLETNISNISPSKVTFESMIFLFQGGIYDRSPESILLFEGTFKTHNELQHIRGVKKNELLHTGSAHLVSWIPRIDEFEVRLQLKLGQGLESCNIWQKNKLSSYSSIHVV